MDHYKKLFIMLGNGFTIDFLNYYSKFDPSISKKIDVVNLFKFGDRINSPWDSRVGFLSYKHCPSLWTLGARANISSKDSTLLIEEIITCANMFLEFVKEKNTEQRLKRTQLLDSSSERLYIRAYCELIIYLKQLFVHYNNEISDSQLKKFLEDNGDWGWFDFFTSNIEKKFNKITIVTYNYDIWLERILKILEIPFYVSELETGSNGIEIIKPHGSISFVPKGYDGKSYHVNYKIDSESLTIEDLEIKYSNLIQYDKGIIIPPSGDAFRLKSVTPWSVKLQTRAEELALQIRDTDEVVLCGLSYGYVDRREIDKILLSLDHNSNFTFINPYPSRDLNAVLISIFSKYVQQSTSSNIGGILNG